MKTLRAAGIGDPVRRELAARDDLTPEDVRAVADATRDDGGGVGLLVHRLRERWTPPPNGNGDAGGNGHQLGRHHAPPGKYANWEEIRGA